MERHTPYTGSRSGGHQPLSAFASAPSSYLRWGFVRHPADRLLSSYCSMLRNQTSRRRRLDLSFHIPKFDAFVDMAIAGTTVAPVVQDHVRPMTYYLCEVGGRLLADFVGRFEHLDRDWQILCSRLQVPFVALPHDNKSEHKPWRECYTDEQLERVAGHYADDLRIFDYAMA